MKLQPLFRLARPGHWIKNVIVFFPVVLALRVRELDVWLEAGAAAVAFCLVSSAAYICNDLQDREKDRLHPRKKNRPLAGGDVSPASAIVTMSALLVAGLAVAAAVGIPTLLVVASYVLLQAMYSLRLKSLMILDVMCIAMGFVLRAAAGAVAIHVEISPYLFICTFTICLFMGFGKRRSEAASIGNDLAAGEHRHTLRGYTPQLLTHLTTLSAGVAIVSYLMYATSERTLAHFGTNYLVYTLPLVIYAVCRFEMLSAGASYSDPTELVLRDRPFQMTIVAWGLAVGAILWKGRALQDWLTQYYH
ncbi:MAG: decaprenyl-phosphate phosphoribosyltransferase [Phycisphaerae bacterium]|jgi:4-hydroxybenzoate polyprenyltransferase